jgi:hypothetical protein
MSGAAGSQGERLRAALTTASLPSSIAGAWSERPPRPTGRQLWRARWGSVTQLLVVLDASARSVRAAPVTLDPELADDSAVITYSDESDLTVPLVVWLQDAASLPVRVLDRFLGAVHVDLRAASALRHGRPVLTAADERAVHRARLQDTLDVFVAARWAPEGDGSLGALLGAARPQQIAQVLGVPNRMVIGLRRGERFLSPQQAELLAPLLHRSAGEVLAANPPLPEDLVADLDLPEYRARITALARREGADEIDTWRAVGYGVAAVSHRQTEGDAVSWRDRIDHYFLAVLDG